MSGLEGDSRQFQKQKRDAYYDSKASFEVKPKTKFPRCKTCKQDIMGQNFSGYCLRCHNEPL